MNFDPKTDEPDDSSRRQKNVEKTYQKLLARGDREAAEALRNADTLTEQVSYIAHNVVTFDPEHDDADTSAKMSIKNAYDGLRELGHDDLADDLRTYNGLSSQNRRAQAIVDEVDGEIDLVTGEVVASDEAASA